MWTLSGRYKRLKLFLSKKYGIRQNVVLNEYQEKAIAIMKHYLFNSESHLLMSPGFNQEDFKFLKRYIFLGKIDDPTVFIIIEQETLQIIDNKILYDIHISPAIFYYISKMFDKEIVKRRKVMEERVKRNIINGLDLILTKIEKSKNKHLKQ